MPQLMCFLALGALALAALALAKGPSLNRY